MLLALGLAACTQEEVLLTEEIPPANSEIGTRSLEDAIECAQGAFAVFYGTNTRSDRKIANVEIIFR